MKIIYRKEDNSVAVMIVSPKSTLTPLEAAKKHVPTGAPFRIIEDADLPVDDTFFDAWEADFSFPDGHGGDV